MSHDELIDQVLRAQDDLREAEERRDEAAEALREAAHQALNAGAGATTIAKAAGVSRQRVYKWASKDYR